MLYFIYIYLSLYNHIYIPLNYIPYIPTNFILYSTSISTPNNTSYFTFYTIFTFILFTAKVISPYSDKSIRRDCVTPTERFLVMYIPLSVFTIVFLVYFGPVLLSMFLHALLGLFYLLDRLLRYLTKPLEAVLKIPLSPKADIVTKAIGDLIFSVACYGLLSTLFSIPLMVLLGRFTDSDVRIALLLVPVTIITVIINRLRK